MSENGKSCVSCDNKLAAKTRALRESVAVVPYGQEPANLPIAFTARDVLANMSHNALMAAPVSESLASPPRARVEVVPAAAILKHVPARIPMAFRGYGSKSHVATASIMPAPLREMLTPRQSPHYHFGLKGPELAVFHDNPSKPGYSARSNDEHALSANGEGYDDEYAIVPINPNGWVSETPAFKRPQAGPRLPSGHEAGGADKADKLAKECQYLILVNGLWLDCLSRKKLQHNHNYTYQVSKRALSYTKGYPTAKDLARASELADELMNTIIGYPDPLDDKGARGGVRSREQKSHDFPGEYARDAESNGLGDFDHQAMMELKAYADARKRIHCPSTADRPCELVFRSLFFYLNQVLVTTPETRVEKPQPADLAAYNANPDEYSSSGTWVTVSIAEFSVQADWTHFFEAICLQTHF